MCVEFLMHCLFVIVFTNRKMAVHCAEYTKKRKNIIEDIKNPAEKSNDGLNVSS